MPRTLTPVSRPPIVTSAVLHGRHPLRGYPVTWRITPVTTKPVGGAVTFVVERADGHIVDDLVWELAEKDTVTMTAAEAGELVRRVGSREA